MARGQRQMFTRAKSVGEVQPHPERTPDLPEGDTGYGVTYGKTTRLGGDTPGSTETAPQDTTATATPQGE